MAEHGQSARLAILIDADNTSAAYAHAIFEEVAKLGEANVRRIYGDFSSDRLRSWRGVMHPLAILPQQQFNYTVGKNAADIALVIDAMDLMHRSRLDGFCLVSSDSDFPRLAQRLREDGALVYGFGARKTPEAFRNACSRFIYIENLLEPTGDEAVAAAAAVAAPKTKTKSDKKAKAADGAKADKQAEKPAVPVAVAPAKEPPSKAVPLIRKAMEQAWDDEEWINLGTVGQRLNHLAPDFDPRTYGCSTLLQVVEQAGKFVVERPPGGAVRIKRR